MIDKKKHLYNSCVNILDEKSEIIQNAYYCIEEKIKKIKSIANDLEQEKINLKLNEFINRNIGNEKNSDELIDFDNFIKSKNQRIKTKRNPGVRKTEVL